MNITFLIGNGFDKALGLKTAYMDFYKWYMGRSTAKLPPCVRKFRSEIKDFVCKDGNINPYWADAERGLANYTERFLTYEVEDFIKCYSDFSRHLMKYLNEQSKKISSGLARRMGEAFIPQLFNFYQEVDPINRDIFEKLRMETKGEAKLNIVTFNYTKSIDKVFKTLSSNPLGSWKSNDGKTHSMITGTLVHAHGYTDRWPIMGVCDPVSIKKQALLRDSIFRSIMVKKESIKRTGERWRSQVIELIRKSKVICIFGMSIGETDSDYWEMIIQWLNEDPNRQLIVFWRGADPKYIPISINEKVQAEDDVVGKLCAHLENRSDKLGKLRNRIHVVIRAGKMFVLPEELKVKGSASDALIEATDLAFV